MKWLFNIRFLSFFVFLTWTLFGCSESPNIENSPLKINEVCPNNIAGLQDEDGDYEDWIEIVNRSEQTVSLKDYFLSDRTEKKQWQLPDVELAANAHLLVFASGKDKRKNYGWKTFVHESDNWSYKKFSEIGNSKWRQTKFDDSDWLTGKGGFGYGDNDDQTEILDSSGFCVRIKFDCTNADLKNVQKAILHCDYDDGFVAWLNGKEIARSESMGTQTIQAKTKPQFYHEARMFRQGNPEKFIIEEAVLKSALQEKENVLCIRAFNVKKSSGDLSLRPFFSLGINEVVENDKPIWWDEKSGQFHSNFKLKEKELLSLFYKTGALCDSATIPKIEENQSFAWATDLEKKASSMLFYEIPSPAKSNSESTGFDCKSKTTKLNFPSGFYKSEIVLKPVSKDVKGEIYFTTDGSEPSIKSALFPDSLTIRKTTVLRIKLIDSDCLPGKTRSYSYFINENHQVKVASLILEPECLWDEESGIYSKGKFANSKSPFKGANFYSGKEVSAHIDVFETERKNDLKESNGLLVVSQQVGLKINGGGSRSRPMKSLRLTARNKYGKRQFKHQFFSSRAHSKFTKLLLKNGGQNFNETHITDALFHQVVDKLGSIETQAYEPCVVYINGVYWGLHNLREKIDAKYLASNFNLTEKDCNILGGVGQVEIAGTNKEFYELTNYIFDHDMGEETNFRFFTDRFDLNNYIDYFCAYTYAQNKDWRRINNVKFWRHPNFNQGKWRFFLVDADMTMGKNSKMTEDQLAYVLENKFRHFKIFSKLIHENEHFKEQFKKRYIELLQTVFSKENMNLELDKIIDQIDNEMPRHFEKWNIEIGKWGNSYKGWQKSIEELRNYFELRPDIALKNLEKNLGE